MTNHMPLKYRFNFPYWLLVICICSVWSMSLIGLDYGARAFSLGWQQALTQTCTSHPESCVSVQVKEQKDWFDTEHHVLVQAQPGQQEAARELIRLALTEEQQQRTSLQVVELNKVATINKTRPVPASTPSFTSPRRK